VHVDGNLPTFAQSSEGFARGLPSEFEFWPCYHLA
jgi:hypothetical protein